MKSFRVVRPLGLGLCVGFWGLGLSQLNLEMLELWGQGLCKVVLGGLGFRVYMYGFEVCGYRLKD